MITTYAIEGMTCGHCEGAVSAELGRLEGVARVDVSAADGTARVEHASALPIEAVRAAVDEAGYAVVDS